MTQYIKTYIPLASNDGNPRGFHPLHIRYGWPITTSVCAKNFERQQPQGMVIWCPWGVDGQAYRFDDLWMTRDDPLTKHLHSDWEFYVAGVCTLAHMLPPGAPVTIYRGCPAHVPDAEQRLAESESRFRRWVRDLLMPEREIMQRLGRQISIGVDALAIQTGEVSRITADEITDRGFGLEVECLPTIDTGTRWKPYGITAWHSEIVAQSAYATTHKLHELGPVTAWCNSLIEARDAWQRGWSPAFAPWSEWTGADVIRGAT